ncbi:unnamed protein product, partial [Nesidiocoris tenuis]
NPEPEVRWNRTIRRHSIEEAPEFLFSLPGPSHIETIVCDLILYYIPFKALTTYLMYYLN